MQNLFVGHFLSIILGGGIIWFCFQVEVPSGFEARVVSDRSGQRPPFSSEGVPSLPTNVNTPVHSEETSLLVAQIDEMRNRLKKNPKDLKALVYLGNANFDIQRFDQARDLYLTALEVDPGNLNVRTDLASCFRNLGESDRAIDELKKVLEFEPFHSTALYNLGVIFLNDKGDPNEAIRYWEVFVRENPKIAIPAGLPQKIEELKKGKF